MYKKFPPKKDDNSHIVKAEPKREWSNYQKNIFKDIAKGTGNTIVIARAGCGKTSVIIAGFKFLPKNKKTLMVAFSADICKELRARAASYVDVRTLHSLGYGAVKNTFGKDIVLDNNKCFNIVSSIVGPEEWELNQNICKCVSLCKAFLIDTPSAIKDIIDEFGIEIFDLEIDTFVSYVIKTLGLCKSQTKIIDYDDMVWFPFVYRLNVGKFDYVFCDEAQDLNLCQMAMVLSAVKPDGRIIGVGDPHQSIFQFRGADSRAIPNLVKKLNAKTLPLPLTYRCPKKVVKLAQEIVPDFECLPTAEEGTLEYVAEKDLLKLVKAGDFVLSRTNAPLIKYCLALLKQGVPANIQGRDIGSNFLWFIKKSKAKSINAFIKYLNAWKKQELDRLLSEGKKTEIVEDKTECLLNLCEGILTIDDLKDLINKLFDDSTDDKKIIFSTTHKAKGLERDRVFVLTHTYRYGPGVEGEEANLWYVAITRARKSLYLVSKLEYKDKD